MSKTVSAKQRIAWFVNQWVRGNWSSDSKSPTTI